MAQNIFLDIGVLIIVAAFFASIGKFIKQPVIPFYILAGVIIGPVFGLIENSDIIYTLSEIGIAFLLFNVGLEMDLKKLRDVEHVTIFGGLAQIIILFTIGFLASLLLGFYTLESVYLGLIITFSSTMIVLKLLSDKREIDTLHGRIIIGIMLVQDIVAVLVLSFLSTINNIGITIIFLSAVKGFLVFAVALLFGNFIFPHLFKFASKSRELLFLLALAVLFGSSLIFYYLGFSIAIGAFVAGLSLASLQYNLEIISITRPLRDFFAVIFFVSLGISLLFGNFNNIAIPIIVLTFLILVVKPIVTLFITSFYGYKKRTSFFVASSMSQTGEFSLILISSGVLLGHIRNEIFTIIVILVTLTITLTSYFEKYDNKLFKLLEQQLKIFDIFSERERDLEYVPEQIKNHIILIGYNRIGYSIVKKIRQLKKKILVVDFNPEIIKKLIIQKINCMYGDASHDEIIEKMNLKEAKAVVSTSQSHHDNLLILKRARNLNKDVIIIVTASQISEALELYDESADYVILPHLLGGEHVSNLLQDNLEKNKRFSNIKKFHIFELNEMLKLGKGQVENG